MGVYINCCTSCGIIATEEQRNIEDYRSSFLLKLEQESQKKNKERNRGNTEHFLGKEKHDSFFLVFYFSFSFNYMLFNFLFQEIQQEHYINNVTPQIPGVR